MSDRPFASVVVPAWRDRGAIEAALATAANPAAELIVAVPLGEADQYRGLEGRNGLRLVEAARSRAAQMNAGAGAALGRWLVFLHADSRLPPDWLTVLATADADSRIAGGAFRLRLDSADWRARAIERGVRWRIRLFALPYGDQGIFVRRALFDALGGYADLPLMEDVDLMRRLRGQGRLFFSTSPVLTSARKWERDGWLRRSARNLALAAQYLLGVRPARLAQRYFGRRETAIVMMARAPWTAGKTRLGGADEEASRALRAALMLDTLDALRSEAGADHLLACEPASEMGEMRGVVPDGVDLFAQRGSSLSERMAHVFEDVFRLGYDSAIVTGSDIPDLPAAAIGAARAALAHRRDRVVLGPAHDGGYYLIGLTRLHPELFEGVRWSTSDVLAQTTGIARRLGLPVVEVAPWHDVDSPGDLDRLAAAPGAGAQRTRAWIRTRRSHAT